MGKQAVTGTLRFPRRYKVSSEEILHSVLSRITPKHYQLKRMKIYETPMSAELEYVKTKTKSRQVHRLQLILSKNKRDLDFRIFPSKQIWPWSKNDFDKNIIDALDRVEIIS